MGQKLDVFKMYVLEHRIHKIFNPNPIPIPFPFPFPFP